MFKSPVFWFALPLAFALLSLPVLFHRQCLLAMSTFVDTSERPQPTDYLLALNGDPDSRPFAAAELYRAGIAKKLLLTTASPTPASADGIKLTEDEIYRRVFISQGVPEQDIILMPGEINSTEDEAAVLATFLADKHPARVSVLTNDFHTRRTRLVFTSLMENRSHDLVVLGVPKTTFRVGNWWRYESGANTYPSEYVKSLVYNLRYRTKAITLVMGVCFAASLLWMIRKHRRHAIRRTPKPTHRRDL